MKLKTVIFTFWILIGNCGKSAALGTRFCYLRISLSTCTQLEIQCISDRSDRLVETPNIGCNVCRSISEYIQRRQMQSCQEDSTSWCQPCPNTTNESSTMTTQMQDDSGDPDSTTQCPLCPHTIANYSPDPTTPSIDCLTSPINVPTSSTSIESEVSSRISDERESLMVAVLSFGVLVGILVVLLVVVTSGWVWTCWRMKRNKVTTPEHVRTTQNTAYGVIGPVRSTTGGQTSGHLERQIENDNQIMNEERVGDNGEEHEYHVLERPGGDRQIHQNRELEMREVTENGEEHAYHVLEGLGGDRQIHQNRELEMKESGEEHAYHVLEGPGGDNASREPERREVGGAMDYEIPLPLKEQ